MIAAERRAKALSHPLRRRILGLLATAEPTSPNRIADVLDEPLGNVSYHVKTLKDLGMVELTGTEPRRGAVEHYYARTEGTIVEETDGDALDRIAAICKRYDEGATNAIDAIIDVTLIVVKTGRSA